MAWEGASAFEVTRLMNYTKYDSSYMKKPKKTLIERINYTK